MFKDLMKDKIGNLLLYLTERIPSLSLTKALKLLYIIDETSVKETGAPITWLEYKAWGYGPVAEDVYSEIKYQGGHKCLDLGKYIEICKVWDENRSKDTIYLKPKNQFTDDEFSDYDIELVDRVISNYGNFTADQLIDLLHKEGDLWDKVVKSHKLDQQFALQQNRSNYIIDFTELLDDEYKKLTYKVAFEANSVERGLNN